MKKYVFITKVFLVLLLFAVLSLIPYTLLVMNFGTYGLWVFALILLLNSYSIIDVFQNRRSNNQTKISWSILLLTPTAMFLLYFLSGKIFWTRKKENSRFDEYEEELFIGNEKRQYNIKCDIEPLIGGDVKFQKFIEDIRNSKYSLDIEYFIINQGILWQTILDAIIIKANEGVKVRLITDYLGNIQNSNKTYEKLLNHENISFAFFNKPKIPFTSGYINQRSHNKIVIIDNKIAYFGGLNIGDDYAHLYPKFGYWYDVHFRVKGELILDIKKQFNLEWFKITKERNSLAKITQEFNKGQLQIGNNLKSEEKTNILALMDGYHSDKTTFLSKILNLIKESRYEIMIVTPYLIIPKELFIELKKAANRGVKIDVITTGVSDKKTAYVASEYYSDSLIRVGINVWRTNGFFLHAKYYIFDDNKILFGTSNIDYRSIYLHFEYNFVFEDKNFVKRMKNESWESLINTSVMQHNSNKKMFKPFVYFISPIL